MNFPLLTILVLLPLVSGIIMLFGRTGHLLARRIGLGISALVLLASLFTGEAAERFAWLPAIGLEYHLAADGISVVFLLLTSLVFLMSLFASGHFAEADSRYYGLMLLLQSGLLGTFTAQNFLHFFLFWELSLIPAFFLVRLYGGAHGSAASLQFFIYTMVGSIAMLIGFLAVFLATGSFEFQEVARLSAGGGLTQGLGERLEWLGVSSQTAGIIVFLLVFLGVAVKVPLWPFHGWLPLTYTEAPTTVTMTLTGAMSKMGVYGLIRLLLPIFPEQIHLLHRPLLALAVVTILYGAFAALAQRDIKRLFAYSSLSHLGYCFLGIFAAAKAGAPDLVSERAAAVNGVMLQVLSHGAIAAAIFAFVFFLEQRTGGVRSYESFGGMRQVNPRFAGLMGIALFASLGLPGLSGFPAEFLIFKGAFTFAPAAAAFAVLGLLFTALYLLTFYGRVFLGPLNSNRSGSGDLTVAEIAVVAPGIALTFIIGIAPQFILAVCNPPVTRLVEGIRF